MPPPRYNSGMRFEVPQFIEIEDKIVGPLTWKQFVYLAGGLGCLIILYLKTSLLVFAMIGIPVGTVSILLAFHRVNNRPFSFFLEALLNYVTKNKLYLWRKEREQVVTNTVTNPKEREFVSATHTPNLEFTRKRSINAMARKLDIASPES